MVNGNLLNLDTIVRSWFEHELMAFSVDCGKKYAKEWKKVLWNFLIQKNVAR